MNTFLLSLFMVLLYGCSSPRHNSAVEKPVKDYEGVTVFVYKSDGTCKVLPEIVR